MYERSNLPLHIQKIIFFHCCSFVFLFCFFFFFFYFILFYFFFGGGALNVIPAEFLPSFLYYNFISIISGGKSQDSRILVDPNNSVVHMGSILLISNTTIRSTKFLRDRSMCTNYNWYNCHAHFSQFSETVQIFLSFQFFFSLWPARKKIKCQVIFSVNTRSGLLAEFWKSVFQKRILCVLISRTDSVLTVHHSIVW